MITTDPGILSIQIGAERQDWHLIAVDGWTGAGKSYLSAALAELGNARPIDLDQFITRRNGTYVNALDLQAIRAELTTGSRPVLLTGICVREVLIRIGMVADGHIYVKRMASWGWADEDEAIGPLPDNLPIEAPSLVREMRAYHAEHHPHQRADYEFHRFD